MNAPKRRLLVGIILLIIILAIVLATYLIQASTFTITQKGLGVSTQFPQANCQKRLTAQFPFVDFRCENPDDANDPALETP
ncbi:MAG: hypothetical protein KC422_09965 [Trueperaceae bacterium]|nr:hypothetical protein [Trueperaceae bacterium]